MPKNIKTPTGKPYWILRVSQDSPRGELIFVESFATLEEANRAAMGYAGHLHAPGFGGIKPNTRETVSVVLGTEWSPDMHDDDDEPVAWDEPEGAFREE
nr:MAG TPA: hypothetical protein [Caudoviricetes sp.]